MHAGSVRAVAFSPDGRFALTGSEDNTAQLWDSETGMPIGKPLRHSDQVRAVAFSPDGSGANYGRNGQHGPVMGCANGRFIG